MERGLLARSWPESERERRHPLGFVMAGLDSESYDRQYSDRELVARIFSYFSVYKKEMAIAIVTILARSVFNAGVPLILARAIDIIAADPSDGLIAALVLGVLVIHASTWVLNYVRQIYSARAIGDVVLQLREDVFSAVARHDLSFYDEQPSGKIVSRVTSDTQDFAATVDLTMNLVSEVLSVVAIAIAAFSINAKLTWLMLAMSPLVFAIALSFRHVARRVTQNARRVRARLNANIQESVSGIAVGKSFRQEAKMYQEFATLNQQSYRIGVLRGLTFSTIFPMLGATFGIAIAVVLYAGGRSALAGVLAPAGVLPPGAITVGEWYLFMQAMGYFWFPMTSIASFWSQFQDGLSAAERAFSLIDLDPRVVQTDSQPVPTMDGRVELRDVCLSYTGEETVLDHYSLTVEAGETVALVGHTGSGKTSVARLVARFYEFQDGDILIDGRDVRTLDLSQYRQRLGFVPQVPFLFSGTVRENIAYGKPKATDDEIQAAVRLVGRGAWIDDLADGLNTDVGERGASLSMGQRQLVALARAMLNDPAILILDEATASVDPFTEALIQEALETVMSHRTAIVIAHRLSTVRNVDRIIVMRDGRIIQEGSHEGLLAQGGHYADLYNTYFRHQSIEYVENAGRLVEHVD